MEEEKLYDAFVNSDIGQKTWDKARELYPAYNDGGEDTIEAAGFILERLMEVPIHCEMDLIYEMIFEGLT